MRKHKHSNRKLKDWFRVICSNCQYRYYTVTSPKTKIRSTLLCWHRPCPNCGVCTFTIGKPVFSFEEEAQRTLGFTAEQESLEQESLET